MMPDVVKLARAAVEAVGKETKGWWRGRGPAAGKMTFRQAATLGHSCGVAVGRMDSGGLGVALSCASAKHSRLFPEVFDDCSHVGCRLSLREWAIIQGVERVCFCFGFLGDGRYWLF